MPELPEVETVRLGLQQHTLGLSLARVEILRSRAIASPSDPALFSFALAGTIIQAWRRRGKYLLADLRHQDGSDAGIWGVHLRMTGQFLWLDRSWQSDEQPPALGTEAPGLKEPEPKPEPEAGKGPEEHPEEGAAPDAGTSRGMQHVRVRLWSDAGDELRFIDSRSFGQMWWVPPGWAPERVITGLARLGPEPFDPAFSKAYLRRRLQGSRRPIKSALLDQSLVAGIGNIYADEALFAAGLRPQRPSGELSDADLGRLRHALVTVLRTSIGAGGTTFSDFRDLQGVNGNYGGQAWVYRRAGQACRTCGSTIERQRIAGRSSHWCPRCQH